MDEEKKTLKDKKTIYTAEKFVTKKQGVEPWNIEYPDKDIPFDKKYDKEYLKNGDTRNVVDKYRYFTTEAIVKDLDKTRCDLHIALENWTHDFNIGSIVRTANAFNVKSVHIIGPKRWNKKGAMLTDKYMHVYYHETTEDFLKWCKKENLLIIAIDNVENSQPIEEYVFPKKCMMVFGTESEGITKKIAENSSIILHITQYGSTRSINAGAAGAIAMYSYSVQHRNNK